jgi:hypothetical protein
MQKFAYSPFSCWVDDRASADTSAEIFIAAEMAANWFFRIV